jgi:hypothetical protein
MQLYGPKKAYLQGSPINIQRTFIVFTVAQVQQESVGFPQNSWMLICARDVTSGYTLDPEELERIP